METKRLPLTIPIDLYRRLAERAQAEDRDVVGQARLILRRALEHEQPDEPKKAAAK